MLQLVYVSSINPSAPCDTRDILYLSRRNNARDRITGLLYADGARFLQALEGDEAAVEATFRRIEQDPRHRAIVMLSRRSVERREFGHWEMAHRGPGADSAAFVDQISRLVANASPNVRATIEGLIQARAHA